MKRSLLERLFWSPNFFTIAIRRRRETDAPIWERLQFQTEYTMPATPDCWAADPMLAEENGKTYLFYESRSMPPWTFSATVRPRTGR